MLNYKVMILPNELWDLIIKNIHWNYYSYKSLLLVNKQLSNIIISLCNKIPDAITLPIYGYFVNHETSYDQSVCDQDKFYHYMCYDSPKEFMIPKSGNNYSEIRHNYKIMCNEKCKDKTIYNDTRAHLTRHDILFGDDILYYMGNDDYILIPILKHKIYDTNGKQKCESIHIALDYFHRIMVVKYAKPDKKL